MGSLSNIDLSVFLKKWKVILVFVLVAFIAGFCRATFFSKPVYECSRAYSVRNTEYYVNDEYSKASTINDTEVSRYLVELYSECFGMQEFLSPLAEFMNTDDGYDLGGRMTAGFLSSAISVERVGEVGLMRIKVTTGDLALTSDISKAIDEFLLPKVSEDLGYAEIKPQGNPMPPVERKASPFNSGIKFALVGAVLALAFILVTAFLNNKIADENELSKRFNIPVLGCIPDPTVKQKGGVRYGK